MIPHGRSSWSMLLAALCSVLFLVTQAFAFDVAILGQAERSVTALRQDLNRIQNELALPNLTAQQIADQRAALENVHSVAVERGNALAGPITEVTQQLESLGPAPAQGQTEAGSITEQRKALTASLNRLVA